MSQSFPRPPSLSPGMAFATRSPSQNRPNKRLWYSSHPSFQEEPAKRLCVSFLDIEEGIERAGGIEAIRQIEPQKAPCEEHTVCGEIQRIVETRLAERDARAERTEDLRPAGDFEPLNELGEEYEEANGLERTSETELGEEGSEKEKKSNNEENSKSGDYDEAEEAMRRLPATETAQIAPVLPSLSGPSSHTGDIQVGCRSLRWNGSHN